ncbi:hypothetical protein Pan216_55480 [Planctomycetes bacterium Pan216]|uniref:Uncharacterized protein n=1 Tax=Kolteria novifilia TaxID=2527975 RepID=A0A518BCH3_9BACT|nr:hypothetical protein Pan216_55480 [Planctomycetes bacterium Pan216]
MTLSPLLLALAHVAFPAADPATIMTRVCEAREKWTPAHVRFQTKLEGQRGTEAYDHVVDQEIWFSGTHLRTDVVIKSSAGSIIDEEAWIKTPAFFAYRYGEAHDIYTGDLADISAAADCAIDPRVLGLVPVSVYAMHNIGLGDYCALVTGATDSSTVREEMVDGRQAVVVSYQNLDAGTSGEVWVIPEMDDAVTRIVVNGSVFRDEIDTTYKEVTAGVWFPSTSSFRRQNSKGKVITDQKVTVEQASIGAPIPDSVFALSSFDIPVGKEVNVGGHPRIWDGEKAVTEAEFAEQRALAERNAASGSTGRTVLVVLAVVILGVVAVLAWRATRKQANPDASDQ